MKRPSLATKITVTVTLLATVILAVGAFISFAYFEREFRAAISLQQEGMVSVTAEELDWKIALVQGELQAIASTVPSAAAVDVPAARRLFESRRYSRVLFENGIFLFSRSGKLLAGNRADPEMIGGDYSFRDYFKLTVSTGKPQVSAPFLSSQSHGHPIVMFTYPVFGAGGEVAGFVGGSLDLLGDNFLGRTPSLRVGESGHLYLFDPADRTFIAHRDPSRIMRRDRSGMTLFTAGSGEVQSAEVADEGGERSLVSLRRLRSAPWVLAAAYPSAEAFLPVERARGIFHIALVPLLLLSALVVRASVGRLTSQLVTFTAHVERLAADPQEKGELPVVTGDEIGTLAGAFNRMIAERGEHERRQVEQKEFFESLLQSTAVPLFVIDGRHRVLIWNRACEELTGIRSEEIIGSDRHWSAFYPTHRPCLADVVVDGRAEELSDLYEIHAYSTLVRDGLQSERWYTSADGRERYLFFDAAPIRNGAGEVVAAIQTLQDITQRREAEEKLHRYAQELTSINDELRSFSYIVSHDLRAPLVNIRGFSGELRFAVDEIERLAGTVPQPQRERLEKTLQGDVTEALDFIESSVGRMDNLINAILKFSRAGRRELRPEPVETAEVVREILRSLSHRIDRRGTAVTLGDLPEVVVDRTSFEQIVGNLLDNAVKYLEREDGGAIAVTAEVGEEEAVFSVRDNGRGIAPEDHEKVFEIFRRAGRQEVPGEGMGLAYVRSLVRRMGGRIWLESSPGEGSVFTFTLPLRWRAEREAA